MIKQSLIILFFKILTIPIVILISMTCSGGSNSDTTRIYFKIEPDEIEQAKVGQYYEQLLGYEITPFRFNYESFPDINYELYESTLPGNLILEENNSRLYPYIIKGTPFGEGVHEFRIKSTGSISFTTEPGANRETWRLEEWQTFTIKITTP